MCLEVPALVVEVDPDGMCATVTTTSRTQRALLVTLDPGADPIGPGDWLLVHSGIAVERLSRDEASDLLQLISQARAEGGDS
jgi:hydrogenase expression/formation protein HypC